VDPLNGLLQLSASEKAERGLEHTLGEIAQQPGTWITTFDHLHRRQIELQSFLSRVGLRGLAQAPPITSAVRCIICCVFAGSAK